LFFTLGQRLGSFSPLGSYPHVCIHFKSVLHHHCAPFNLFKQLQPCYNQSKQRNTALKAPGDVLPPPVAAQSLALDCPARTGIIHTRSSQQQPAAASSSQQQPLVWPLGPTHLALPCPASQELPVLCSRTVIWSMLEKSPHLIPHYFCGRLLFFLLEKLGCGLVLWVSFLASSGYLPTYHRHLVLSFHIQNLHTYNNTAASLPTYDIPRLSSTTSPTTSARAPQP
jgi:hypothetical protein